MTFPTVCIVLSLGTAFFPYTLEGRSFSGDFSQVFLYGEKLCFPVLTLSSIIEHYVGLVTFPCDARKEEHCKQ